jgi:hypothetical protein
VWDRMKPLSTFVSDRIMLWDPALSQAITELHGPKASRTMQKLRKEYLMDSTDITAVKFHFLPKFEDDVWSIYVISNIGSYLQQDESQAG